MSNNRYNNSITLYFEFSTTRICQETNFPVIGKKCSVGFSFFCKPFIRAVTCRSDSLYGYVPLGSVTCAVRPSITCLSQSDVVLNCKFYIGIHAYPIIYSVNLVYM